MQKICYKKLLVFALAFLIGCIPHLTGLQAQAAKVQNELNIYAVYLDSEQKGESVILESRGEYLVMDLGVADCTKAVVRKLQELGAERISVYFSHLHKDHIGSSDTDMLAGLKMLIEADIQIDTLYLPDPSLAPESTAYPMKYQRITDFMSQYSDIKYLLLDSEIEIGDAWLNVIGPTNPELIHPQDYEGEEYDPDGDTVSFSSYTYYENNCSLISQVICGNTVYLATGDALKDEMQQTIKRYGGKSGLDVDIMKLSHHGTASGNIASTLASMDPEYSFAQNTYYTGINSSTGEWRVYGSYRNAVKHGMVYYVGSEKKTLIYHIADDQITMYEDSIAEENRISGWKKVIGADGKNRKYDYYYINEDGTIATGIQKFEDHYYHFSQGGALVYGDYDENGNYLGWRAFDEHRRYYMPLSDGRDYMCSGFTKMPDGKTYFFSKSGYFQEATGEMFFRDIGNYTYAFDTDGSVIQNRMMSLDGNTVYFDKNGRKAVGKIVSYNGNKYYFGTNGAMEKDKMITLDGGRYYLAENGAMVCNTLYTVDGVTHYFFESGKMAQNEFATINKKEYYYNAAGLLEKDRFITLDGNSYYVDENGVKTVSQERTIDGRDYYFDAKGVMAKEKLVNLDGDTYYYGKSGVRAKGEFIDMEDATYYAGEDGRIAKDGMQEIAGKNYYFTASGKMKKHAFVKENGNTMYFGKYGAQVIGQKVKSGGATYYLNENGYMVKKSQVMIGDHVYYFDGNGKMVTKKVVKIAGHKYYFGTYGTMVKGKKVRIDGKAYYFDTNGMLVMNRYINIGNRWYYCDKAGRMAVAKDYPGAQAEPA